MRKALCSLALLGLVSCAALACGSDKPAPKDTGDTKQVCDPGTIFSCVMGTCNGHRSCFSDGSAFTPCVCDDADASAQAGTGGGAGTGAIGDGGAGTTVDASTEHEDASTTPTQPEPRCDGKQQCVPAASGGFAGPVELYVGSAAPPKCDAAFALEAFAAGEDPSGDPATCSACTCTPSSATCPTFLDFSTSAAAACADPSCTTSVSASCVEISPPCIASVGTASLKSKLASATSTCKASKQVPTKSAAAFDTHVLACVPSAAEQGACKHAEVCATDPSSKFQPELCIWKAGSQACPAGDYSDHRVYYRKLADTRACSACACDGPDCTTSWQVFAAADTTCTTPIVSLSSADQCVQVNPTSDKLRVGVTIGGTGACDASGGAAEGDVTGDDPVTVCCLN